MLGHYRRYEGLELANQKDDQLEAFSRKFYRKALHIKLLFLVFYSVDTNPTTKKSCSILVTCYGLKLLLIVPTFNHVEDPLK